MVTPIDAENMLTQTGCDGIMIARAARGNPWIFKQVKEYLNNGTVSPKIEFQEVADMIIRHCRMVIDYKGEYTGIREMRKHISWYISGFPGAAKFRSRINQIETADDLELILEEYKLLYGKLS